MQRYQQYNWSAAQASSASSRAARFREQPTWAASASPARVNFLSSPKVLSPCKGDTASSGGSTMSPYQARSTFECISSACGAARRPASRPAAYCATPSPNITKTHDA